MVQKNLHFGNGVNVQPSYYNQGDVEFGWNLMKNFYKIKTLRIEIEPNRAAQARSWIQQACGHGYAVIATYHKHHDYKMGTKLLGTDSIKELIAATNWWKSNYNNLIGAPVAYKVQRGETLGIIAEKFYGDPSKQTIIKAANGRILKSSKTSLAGNTLTIPAYSRSFTINIINEWGSHDLIAKNYADAYNNAITMIRGFYRKPIIIDVPGFAQETAVAASAIKGYKTGGAKISDTNIILSVHIYPTAFVKQKTGAASRKSGHLTNSDLDDLRSTGRSCIVGEFGSEGKGSANWAGLVDHAKSLNWPRLAWAWNGDGGKMNMVSPRWGHATSTSNFKPSSYLGKVYPKL